MVFRNVELEAESSTNLKQIDSHFDKAKAVATKTSPLGTHPNEETNKQLVALIGDTRKKVLDAWSLLYARQKNEIFVWPKT